MYIAIPLASLLIVAAFGIAALRVICSAYEKLLAQRDKEYEILADRRFLKERLPPSGVDLTEVHQERVEEERVRKAETRLRGKSLVARGIGPVDVAQNDMLRQYRKDHPQPASAVLEEQIHTRQNTGAVA